MKRPLSALLLLLFLLSLCGCTGTYRATDLDQLAREEFPVSDKDALQVRSAGATATNGKVLFWYISEFENNTRYYLALECEEVGEDRYRFIQARSPITAGADIACVPFESGYSILVNNPDCVCIRYTDSAGHTWDEEIPPDSYPYIAYETEDHTSRIQFLDKDGNEIL